MIKQSCIGLTKTIIHVFCSILWPGGSDGKESTLNAGNLGLIPGLGRSPEGGNDTPLQYSCLGKPMGRGAWQAIAYGVTEELDTTQRLNSSSSPPRPAAVL